MVKCMKIGINFNLIFFFMIISLIQFNVTVLVEDISTENKNQLSENQISNSNKDSNNSSLLSLNNVLIHSPINITKNEEFSFLGFLGNGTDINPYIIENLSISDGNMNLITIMDTNAHFIIRNNSLDGVSAEYTGIYLVNVSNAQIINNSISNTNSGIYFIMDLELLLLIIIFPKVLEQV